MERRIYLVNAFNTSEHFELSIGEAMKLLRVDAVEFCLGDSLDHDFIAVHATVDHETAYPEAVRTIASIRERLNPLTGEQMKVINLFGGPHSRANAN